MRPLHESLLGQVETFIMYVIPDSILGCGLSLKLLNLANIVLVGYGPHGASLLHPHLKSKTSAI